MIIFFLDCSHCSCNVLHYFILFYFNYFSFLLNSFYLYVFILEILRLFTSILFECFGFGNDRIFCSYRDWGWECRNPSVQRTQFPFKTRSFREFSSEYWMWNPFGLVTWCSALERWIAVLTISSTISY